MRFTETITVYNKIPQQGREPEKLRRTVVHGVFWDYTTGAAFGKSGKDDSDSITVMIPDSMKITTERGVLFTTASGKSILRWNGGKPPTDDGFNKLQVFIDNTVARHMDPYVTMRTGMLKKSVILGSRMGSGELVFIAPYAHKQYYRNGKLKGKRGSRWFHRMWAAFKDTIVREVKNYARRLMP